MFHATELMGVEPKKGSKCHRMLDCGHVFCTECLQDFYNDAIQQGMLETVRCLEPSCAKQRGKAQDKRKPRTSLSPSELLKIGLSQETVKRYISLKYKTELEADKNTIYCPRQWCNGAARSKKHKKPTGLDDPDDDDDGAPEDVREDSDKEKKLIARADLLSVCEDCGLAFCSRCLLSWHGEYVICQPKRETAELTAEEAASLDYINLYTSPCPTCDAPASKTHGCNHMICSRCNTHFCYLCSAWLDPDNPYRHYNEQPGGKVTSCYMRLWELEQGHDDGVGLGFAGGRRTVDAPRQPVQVAAPPRVNARGPPMAQLNNVQVAREAPLVLRLMNNNPQPVEAPAEPAEDVQLAGRQEHADFVELAFRAVEEDRQGIQRLFGRGGARGGARGRGRGRGRGQAQRLVLRPRDPVGQEMDAEAAMLDEAQQAWVRNFVEMALMDAEDEIEDSDEEGEEWAIP